MSTTNLETFAVRFSLALIILTGMLGVKPANIVHASTITVTNANDSGARSLRQAIADAVSGDTITFDPSLSGQTIVLSSTLSIDKNLTIDGSLLTSKISISGNNSVRIFDISSNNKVLINSLMIIDGKIIGNGGAINNGGTLNIVNTGFYGNKTQYEPDVVGVAEGGAIYNYGGNLTITNSFFADNSASWGGAITCETGQMTVINSTFFSNRTTSIVGYGGAIFDQACISTVANSTFSNNSADKGGAINTNDDQNTVMAITNSTFYHNTGSSAGGAIASYGIIVIKNSTFSDNNSPNGGAIRFGLGSVPYVYNSILANSMGGPDCSKSDHVQFSANSRNLIETIGIDPERSCGTAYLTADPKLGQIWSNSSSHSVMALLQDSPAIDAGDNATCTVVDERGVARPQGSRCDLGAVEMRDHIYVKWDATGTNNGSSWKNAYTDLQSALSDATSGEEIWVAAGTYKPTTGTDRTISFVLNDSMELYGGFLGTETARSQHTTSGRLTILSGDIGVVGDTSDNSLQVIFSSALNNPIVLDGFTITAGNANDLSFGIEGGGIYNNGPLNITNSIISSNSAIYGGGIQNGGALVISNSVISGNSADFGGGIMDQDSSIIITDSIFLENSAKYNGAGISKNGGKLSIRNSAFLNNSSQGIGGGIHIDSGSLDIANSNFSNNASIWGGGGITISGPLIITGSTFANNSSTIGSGGGIAASGEKTDITNSTFFQNSAAQNGGGISSAGILNITNSTFSDNSSIYYGSSVYNGGILNLVNSILANSISGDDCFNNGTIGLSTNNLIESNAPSPYQCGAPALTGDPKLDVLSYKNGLTSIIELLPDSPAIDAGDDVSCSATDQRGVKRPQGSHCDIGAYEYLVVAPRRPVLKSQALTPLSLDIQSGATDGTSSNLNLLDQTGTNDDPAAYISFQTSDGPYRGYQSFSLPEGTQAKLISTMLLQLNVKAPASSTQVWTWSIYDPTSNLWIKIGDSMGIEADQWQSLVFRIRQPWKYVSPGNEIRIQITSNNANGDLKVDYEALHVTYLSLPSTSTSVAPVVPSNRPGISSVPIQASGR